MPKCNHCKNPIKGHPVSFQSEGKPSKHYHPEHAQHHKRQQAAAEELAVIVEAYPKAYGVKRFQLADDLMRIVLAHPRLLPDVPDAVLGRADKDSPLSPGFGDEPEGYRIKVNRWELERSGRDPALAEQWAAEDRARRLKGVTS